MNSYSRSGRNTKIPLMEEGTPDRVRFLRDSLEEGFETYDGNQDPKIAQVTTNIHQVLRLGEREQEAEQLLFPSLEFSAKARSYFIHHLHTHPDEDEGWDQATLENMPLMELATAYLFPRSMMTMQDLSTQEKMNQARFRSVEYARILGVSSFPFFQEVFACYTLREGIATHTIRHLGLDVDKLHFPPHFPKVSSEDAEFVREKIRDVLAVPVVQDLLTRTATLTSGDQVGLFDAIRPGLHEQMGEIMRTSEAIADYAPQRIGQLERMRQQLQQIGGTNGDPFATAANREYAPIRTFLGAAGTAGFPLEPAEVTALTQALDSLHTRLNNVQGDPVLGRGMQAFMSKVFAEMTTGEFKDMQMDQVFAELSLSAQETMQLDGILAKLKGAQQLFGRFAPIRSSASDLLSYIDRIVAGETLITTSQSHFNDLCTKIGVTPTVNIGPPHMLIDATTGFSVPVEHLQWFVATQKLDQVVQERVLRYGDGKKLIGDIKNLKKEESESINQRRTQQVLLILNNTYEELGRSAQMKELEMKKDVSNTQATEEYQKVLDKMALLKSILQKVQHPKITLENFELLRAELSASGALYGHLTDDDMKHMEDQIHQEVETRSEQVIESYSEEFFSKEIAQGQEVEHLLRDCANREDFSSMASGRYRLFTQEELDSPHVSDQDILDRAASQLNLWEGRDPAPNALNKNNICLRNGAWFRMDLNMTVVKKNKWKPWKKGESTEESKTIYLRMEGFDRRRQEVLCSYGVRVPLKLFMASILAGTDRSRPGMEHYTGKAALGFVYDEQSDDQRDKIMTLPGLEKRLGVQVADETEGDVDQETDLAEIKKQAKFRPGAVLTCTNADDDTKTDKIGTVKKVDLHSQPPQIYFKELDRPMAFPEILFLFKNTKGMSIVPPEYKVQQDKWQGVNTAGLIKWASLSDIKQGVLKWAEQFKTNWQEKAKIRLLEVQIGPLELLYKTVGWKTEHEDLVDQYKGEIDKQAKKLIEEIKNMREDSDVLAKIKEYRASPPNMGTFEGRWKWQGLLIAVLERYGTLYPFEEMKNWEKNDKLGGFWIRAFAPNNPRLYKAAIEHATESAGAGNASAEIARLQSVLHYNMYFGDSVASTVERSYETGKKNAAETAVKRFKGKVTTPEQAGVLADMLRNQRYSAALALFKEYAAKEFNEESMFNMFMYFFDSICYSDGQQYRSKIPLSELMQFAKDLVPMFPTPYFQVFRSEERFRAFANIMYRNSITAQYGWVGHEQMKDKSFKNANPAQLESLKWEFGSNGMPKPKYNDGVRSKNGKSTSLYQFFSAVGDFSIFEGAEHKKAENIPNEGRKEIWTWYLDLMKNQALTQASRNYFGDHMDPKCMTKHVMLTSMGGDIFGSMKWEATGEFAKPGYQFTFEAILKELKKLKETTDLSEKSKEQLLRMYNASIFKAFYGSFKYDESRSVKGQLVGDKRREAFIKKYGGQLKSLGFDPISGQQDLLIHDEVPKEEWAQADVAFNAIHKLTGKPYKPLTREAGWEQYVDWEKTQKLPWGIRPTEDQGNMATEAAKETFIPGVQADYNKKLNSVTARNLALPKLKQMRGDGTAGTSQAA